MECVSRRGQCQLAIFPALMLSAPEDSSPMSDYDCTVLTSDDGLDGDKVSVVAPRTEHVEAEAAAARRGQDMVDILDDDLLCHILWKLDAAGLRAAQQVCVAWSRVARHMLESSEWQAAALTLTMLLSRHEASEQALEIALANSDEAALRRFFRYFKRNCMGRACVPTKLHGLMRKNPHLGVWRRESLDQMAQRAADLYSVGRREEVALLQRKARATFRTIRQHNARSGLEASMHAASLEQLPNQGRSLAAPWSLLVMQGGKRAARD